jgi:hypothetical protein
MDRRKAIGASLAAAAATLTACSPSARRHQSRDVPLVLPDIALDVLCREAADRLVSVEPR